VFLWNLLRPDLDQLNFEVEPAAARENRFPQYEPLLDTQLRRWPLEEVYGIDLLTRAKSLYRTLMVLPKCLL